MEAKILGNRKKRLEELMRKAADDPIVNEVVEGKNKGDISEQRKFLFGGDSYAEVIQALREMYEKGECPKQPLFTCDDGSKIARPFTIKENIEARVFDYWILKNPDGSERTKKERLGLFNIWLDSCTGMASKEDSSKFKIVPVCRELIEIDPKFDQEYICIDYSQMKGIELDCEQPKEKCCWWLAKDDVLNHSAWRAVVEDDINLLKAYADIVFACESKPRLMPLEVRNSYEDALDMVSLDKLERDSALSAMQHLANNSHILMVRSYKNGN